MPWVVLGLKHLKSNSDRCILWFSSKGLWVHFWKKWKDDESKIYECLGIATEAPDDQIPIPGSRNATWFHTSCLGKPKLEKKFALAISAMMVISSVVMIRQLVPAKKEYTCLVILLKAREESNDSDVNEFFDDDDSEGDAQSDMEENELFSHTEFSNTIYVGKIIAIYSISETVNEPFFLCRVLEKKVDR